MRCSVHGSMPCSKRRSFSNDVSEVRFRPHVSCHTYTYTAVPVSGRKCGLLTSETSCKSVSCHTADRSLAPSAICSAFCTHRAPRACETETVRAEPTGTAHATRRQAQGDFLASLLAAPVTFPTPVQHGSRERGRFGPVNVRKNPVPKFCVVLWVLNDSALYS